MDYALEDFWKFSKVVMTDKISIEIIPIYNTIKKNISTFRAVAIRSSSCKTG
jgi:hypothetical protein